MPDVFLGNTHSRLSREVVVVVVDDAFQRLGNGVSICRLSNLKGLIIVHLYLSKLH